jgi:predicted metalloprotease with PDZ domain
MWDETMAESIVMALRDNPDRKMVVLAGTGHVFKDSAIPPRVARRMKVRQSVVAADNGMDRGLQQGKKLDYLMFVEPLELEPAGKIGVVLNEIKGEDNGPGRVEIIQVSPHGKAGAAGIREKDIILAIDGFEVTTVGDLKAGLLDKSPGDTVSIKVKRDGKILELEVELSNMDRAAMMMPPGHPKK